MADQDDRVGFEFSGEFFDLTVNFDNGKDLILIDRLTRMPVDEFQEAVQDGVSIGRGPVMMAVLATSIRAKHPNWTIERILSMVISDLSELVFIGATEEEESDADGPPAETSELTPETPSSSTSPSDVSSPPSTPEGPSTLETLYAIPS